MKQSEYDGVFDEGYKYGKMDGAKGLAELEEKIKNGTLKETKTCKNITEQHPVDEFICSECGLILQDYCKKRLDEDGDEYFFEFEIKYCPCCGAKVED